MKETIKIFKVDTWWKFVLLLGLVLITSVFSFDIGVINEKHLLGLGAGLLTIGIAYFKANKHINIPYQGGILSTEKVIHDIYSIIILAIGLVITILFFTLLIIGLLH